MPFMYKHCAFKWLRQHGEYVMIQTTRVKICQLSDGNVHIWSGVLTVQASRLLTHSYWNMLSITLLDRVS